MVDEFAQAPHNILLRKAREVGIGIALSDAPDNKLHWIINFGTSK